MPPVFGNQHIAVALTVNRKDGHVPVKKRDTNQMELFAMTNPELPDTPPSTPAAPPPEKSLLPPDETATSSEQSNTPASPQPDTSFNPADWESIVVDSTVPFEPAEADCMTEPTPDTDAKDDFALFDSDPFFNPAVATHQPAPAKTTPPPSAEERLLDDIVQTNTSGAKSTQLQTALASLSHAESELSKTRQEAESLRLRCATLETERDAACREAEKERQLRAEAIRNRPLSTFKPVPQELQPSRQNLPGPFISKRALIYALPGMLVLCLLAYSLGRRQAPGSITFMGVDEMPGTSESPALPVIPPPEPMRAEPVSVTWPSLKGTGFNVTGDNHTRRIVFSYGTFSRGTLLSETAQRDLAKIAAALKSDISSFRIEVEGHTDATPVRSTHAFADNHELALARATATAEFLTGKCGLPADAVSAIAADNTTPPHPGTTPDIQKKNRTVVLNITRR